ncbi:hypothetical protein CRUP_025425 [Coryphaenoides rupestris]|nr:hypothetical protein CRUP_025425 [Coryphaenoides rupestris]
MEPAGLQMWGWLGFACLSWICLGQAVAGPHYMVTIPAVLEAGAESRLCASLLSPNESLHMTVTLKSKEENITLFQQTSDVEFHQCILFKVKAVYFNDTPIPNKVLHLFEGQRWSVPQLTQNLTTDSDGVASFSFNTSRFEDNIKLTVSALPTLAYQGYRIPHYENDEHVLSVFRPKTEDTPTNSELEVKTRESELVCNVEEVIKILARGAISTLGLVKVEVLDKPVTKGEITIKLKVSPDMAPLVQVVVYAGLPSENIIAHKADFDTEKCFANQVSLEFSPSAAVPGEENRLQLRAQPDSLCGISAVDQSVLIKHPGKRLNADRVSVSPALSSDYTLTPLAEAQQASCLCAHGRRTHSWKLTPTALGPVNVTMIAEAVSSHTSCDNEIVSVPERGRIDVVTRSLIVKAEGTEQTKTYNILLCPRGESLQEQVELSLPEDVIQGSARASEPLINKSLSCLRQSLGYKNNTYATALLAYVFTLAGDMETRSLLLEHLDNVAIQEGGNLHWSQRSEKSMSLSVEISSYVLLATLSATPTTADLGYASRIVRWLTTQQNSYGGFSSTQDTVVALQALALYSTLVFSPEGSSTVDVHFPSGQMTFEVNQDNKLLYQERALTDMTGKYSVEVKGTACVSMQLSLHYNIPTPRDESSFQIMFSKCVTVKHNLNILQDIEVENLKPAVVKIYDYYQPSDQAETEYNY